MGLTSSGRLLTVSNRLPIVVRGSGDEPGEEQDEGKRLASKHVEHSCVRAGRRAGASAGDVVMAVELRSAPIATIRRRERHVKRRDVTRPG